MRHATTDSSTGVSTPATTSRISRTHGQSLPTLFYERTPTVTMQPLYMEPQTPLGAQTVLIDAQSEALFFSTPAAQYTTNADTSPPLHSAPRRQNSPAWLTLERQRYTSDPCCQTWDLYRNFRPKYKLTTEAQCKWQMRNNQHVERDTST